MAKKVSDDKILGMPVHEISSGLADGRVSSVELVQGCLERTMKLNERLRAFIRIESEDKLLAAARRADQEIKDRKVKGIFHGVPVGVKDGTAVAGMPNTSGSKILRDFVPNYDATVVSRLKQ